MLIRKLLGWFFLCIAVFIVIYTLAFPRHATEQHTISLTPEKSGIVQVTLPDRGWVGDKAEFDLNVIRQDADEEPLTLSARLELVGIETKPSGKITSVVGPGEGAEFSWEIQPHEADEVKGILWLFCENEEGKSKLVYAREIKYKAGNFWIIHPLIIRVAASVFTIIGFFLIFKRGNFKIS